LENRDSLNGQNDCVYKADSTVEPFNDLTRGENAACEGCGSFDAMEIAGKILCRDCVALAGCGCAGDGGAESQ
jgi:hypothetical protein